MLRCVSDAATVGLDVPERLSNRVSELLVPFIEVTRDSWRPLWTVTIGRKADRPEAAVPVDVTSNGEPETILWFDRAARLLLVPEELGEEFAVQNAARYVRIILRLSSMASGALFLHAGLVVGDRGVAILGDKRAGKTTTIASAMLGGGRFVANDDLSLHATELGWHGRGWPRSVAVRGDTFGALGIDLDTRLHDRGVVLTHPANRTVATLLSADERTHGQVLCYPREFAALLDTEVRTSAPIDALVFPGWGETSMRRLVPSQAVDLLRRNLLPNPVKHADFLLGDLPIPPVDESALVDIAELVPAFALRQDFTDLTGSARLMNALLWKETS